MASWATSRPPGTTSLTFDALQLHSSRHPPTKPHDCQTFVREQVKYRNQYSPPPILPKTLPKTVHEGVVKRGKKSSVVESLKPKKRNAHEEKQPGLKLKRERRLRAERERLSRIDKVKLKKSRNEMVERALKTGIRKKLAKSSSSSSSAAEYSPPKMKVKGQKPRAVVEKGTDSEEEQREAILAARRERRRERAAIVKDKSKAVTTAAANAGKKSGQKVKKALKRRRQSDGESVEEKVVKKKKKGKKEDEDEWRDMEKPDNIAGGRITLGDDAGRLGVFGRGAASRKVRPQTKKLTDLVFSELKFLNRKMDKKTYRQSSASDESTSTSSDPETEEELWKGKKSSRSVPKRAKRVERHRKTKRTKTVAKKVATGKAATAQKREKIRKIEGNSSSSSSSSSALTVSSAPPSSESTSTPSLKKTKTADSRSSPRRDSRRFGSRSSTDTVPGNLHKAEEEELLAASQGISSQGIVNPVDNPVVFQSPPSHSANSAHLHLANATHDVTGEAVSVRSIENLVDERAPSTKILDTAGRWEIEDLEVGDWVSEASCHSATFHPSSPKPVQPVQNYSQSPPRRMWDWVADDEGFLNYVGGHRGPINYNDGARAYIESQIREAFYPLDNDDEMRLQSNQQGMHADLALSLPHTSSSRLMFPFAAHPRDEKQTEQFHSTVIDEPQDELDFVPFSNGRAALLGLTDFASAQDSPHGGSIQQFRWYPSRP
ncbi:hypothetical protein BT69DRAFT_1276528 [Atractiella rhizophila]|nr:hypothetical protein BT69DRAFT_1283875 [Atractiella rhizophila]KAH8929258.1 hypothetical protein BT69DRAFT_1276528 [Atractiella rhizophila]